MRSGVVLWGGSENIPLPGSWFCRIAPAPGPGSSGWTDWWVAWRNNLSSGWKTQPMHSVNTSRNRLRRLSEYTSKVTSESHFVAGAASADMPLAKSFVSRHNHLLSPFTREWPLCMITTLIRPCFWIRGPRIQDGKTVTAALLSSEVIFSESQLITVLRGLTEIWRLWMQAVPKASCHPEYWQ